MNISDKGRSSRTFQSVLQVDRLQDPHSHTFCAEAKLLRTLFLMRLGLCRRTLIDRREGETACNTYIREPGWEIKLESSGDGMEDIGMAVDSLKGLSRRLVTR